MKFQRHLAWWLVMAALSFTVGFWTGKDSGKREGKQEALHRAVKNGEAASMHHYDNDVVFSTYEVFRNPMNHADTLSVCVKDYGSGRRLCGRLVVKPNSG